MKLQYTLSKIKAHPNNWSTTIIFKVLLKFFYVIYIIICHFIYQQCYDCYTKKGTYFLNK